LPVPLFFLITPGQVWGVRCHEYLPETRDFEPFERESQKDHQHFT
jgi:hypothetical protein